MRGSVADRRGADARLQAPGRLAFDAAESLPCAGSPWLAIGGTYLGAPLSARAVSIASGPKRLAKSSLVHSEHDPAM